MRPSKEKLNNAGKALNDNPNNHEAFGIVNDYRALHALPLVRFRTNLHIYFEKNRVKRLIVQRLKRMPTIISKISRISHVDLADFQDIGGIRCVVDNMSDVYALKENLQKEKRSDFSFVQKREKDYIKKPKTERGYGYRSIHLIYEFISAEDKYNKLQIELQIRTKLQHLWATAVETIDIIKNQSLKSGTGDPEWHKFFAVTSSLFAMREKTAVLQQHQGKTETALLEEFTELEKKLQAIETLKGIIKIPEILKFKQRGTKYCLIILDLQTKNTEIKEFKGSELERANTEYANIEQNILINKSQEIAVLAAAQNARKLREGYLGYYLDVQDFIKELENLQNEFHKNTQIVSPK